MIEYDIERNNFLSWYKVADLKELAKGMKINQRKFEELKEKYKLEVSLIDFLRDREY